ncbi:hypothetical protein TrLO_g7111 [Triparma laevis f. longispina]|uniref:RING-CH-type domain-containing protein n=1 Tax=Triparma laevis f. longispina TaxID=1714387 RepID=A0A9W6ZW88_9STRA|nr:hypothetical protein TrLO_g7111 [Triparma laevis f. longispina]
MASDLRELRLRRFGGVQGGSVPQQLAAPSPPPPSYESDDDLSVEDIFASEDCNVPIHPPTNPVSPFSPAQSPPPRSPPSTANENNNSPPTCRICFGNADSSNSPLISPCHCRGTQQFVHLNCLNHWRRSTTNPAALRQCQTCQYQYNIARSKLSIVICDHRTIYSVAISLLILITLTLGNLTTKLLSYFGCHPASYIYSLARYNRRNFYQIFQTENFDELVVGCFMAGAFFCLRHLRSQLSIIMEMRDERQLGLFAIWCASLFQNPAFASRTAIIIGTALAAKEIIEIVESEGKQLAQTIGERILEPEPPQSRNRE